MTETSWELEESNRYHSNPQGAMKGQSVPCLAEQPRLDGTHEIGAWERRTRGHRALCCGGAAGGMARALLSLLQSLCCHWRNEREGAAR